MPFTKWMSFYLWQVKIFDLFVKLFRLCWWFLYLMKNSWFEIFFENVLELQTIPKCYNFLGISSSIVGLMLIFFNYLSIIWNLKNLKQKMLLKSNRIFDYTKKSANYTNNHKNSWIYCLMISASKTVHHH